MAIVVETFVPNASSEQCDAFDASMESAMMQRGGPPDGLMVHFAKPDGDGFQLCNIWRSEDTMRPFYDEVVLPKLAEAGLSPEPPRQAPIWILARP